MNVIQWHVVFELNTVKADDLDLPKADDSKASACCSAAQLLRLAGRRVFYSRCPAERQSKLAAERGGARVS